MDAYPKRDRFFAHRACRLMAKTCLAQDIGTDAVFLLTVIAHQEDSCRYRGPVSFYTDQLLPILGFAKWDRLDKARKAATEAGWLSYEPGSTRKPGWYFVTVPACLSETDDAPISESAEESDYTPIGGQSSDTNLPHDIPFGVQSGGQSKSIIPSTGENGGITRVQRGVTSIPIPFPIPKENPLPPKGDVSEKRARKQIEVSDVPIPSAMDTPEVRQSVSDWLSHKRSLGKGYKDGSAVSRIFNKFNSPAAFVEAVDHSIAQNYQGIYPPSGAANANLFRGGQGSGGQSARPGRVIDPSQDDAIDRIMQSGG